MWKICSALLLICLVERGWSMGLDLSSLEAEPQTEDERLIIVTTGASGSLFGINLTQLLPLLALAAAALLPLLCLCALALLLLWKDDGYGGGYGGGGYGHHSSYSEYSRALGLDFLDWEKLSIIDWVAMGEETFRKFDPTNLTCQTRLVCEIHQNAKKFGKFGKSLVEAFGYLKYFEVLGLPDILKDIVSAYMEAAYKGRSETKDCGDMYSDCDFSINNIYDRYNRNDYNEIE